MELVGTPRQQLSGEYENMGTFPNGNDKGYRFRWSTFGNTSLNQLPYVQGVSSNDQIAAAAGNSHYVVYDANATDVAAANCSGRQRYSWS